MAPYSATSRELSGAAKASLRLGLGHPLYTPQACSLLPPPSVRLLSTEAIAYLITISSSFIDSLCDSCSACLLPTVHLGDIASHLNRSYTLPGGSRQQAEGFALKYFSRSSIFYLGRSRILQSSYTSRRLADRIRITVLEYGSGPLLPRTIAYAAEQLHQQVSGRSHPHNGWLNTDQEKDGRQWPPSYELGAI